MNRHDHDFNQETLFNQSAAMTYSTTLSHHDNSNNQFHTSLPSVQYEEIWTVESVQRIVGIALLMVITLCGNVTILVVLGLKGVTLQPHQRSTSRVNIFIINLAIGDLTVLAFTMTSEVLFVVLKRSWTLGNPFCKVLVYVQIITLASTTFLLTGMSIDRYLAICKPLKSLIARPRKIIIASWILAFVFASPQLFIFKQKAVGVYPDGELKLVCASMGYTAWWQRKTYFTFMTVYILVAPFFIISFCYINVAKIVWSQANTLKLKGHSAFKFTDDDKTNADAVDGYHVMPEVKRRSVTFLRKSVKNISAISKAKIKTVKMTLSIICIFMICWTPYFVVHLIHIWSEYEYEIPQSVYAFAETLAFLNSALNPVIYGCFNVRLKRKSQTNLSENFSGQAGSEWMAMKNGRNGRRNEVENISLDSNGRNECPNGEKTFHCWRCR